MKNYDVLFILACLFILRVVAFSASYGDAICLVGLLAYKLGKDFLDFKKISIEEVEQLKKDNKKIMDNIQIISNEVVDSKNNILAVKAALNLIKK